LSELALFLVRTGFLVVLWIFVFSIISVIRADLFGQRVVSKVASANAPQVFSSPTAPVNPGATANATNPLASPTGSGMATKLVITEGDQAGRIMRLDRREITIGRSDGSDLVVDDEYASTNHAKLVLVNNDWLIQDLNSTNGTFLDGQRVGTPAVVKLNTRVRVGKTVFELRA
jgi:pSer/pThr/pTyr-binding forkhead associated (FHA) protein